MEAHNLIRRSQQYYCQICKQTWKGKPRKTCPGATLVSHNSDLAIANKPEDYLIKKNLRLVDLVCCYKKDKKYYYLYNPEGATVPYYPELPPAIEYPNYSQIQDFYNPSYDEELCLKNETGLKSLNLKPNGKPVRCWWDGSDYQMLYNPLDGILLDDSLPKIFRGIAELRQVHQRAIAQTSFNSLNLTAKRQNAVGVIWENRNWNYYYQFKDTFKSDPNLPPVYRSYENLTEAYPQAIHEKNLAKLNLIPNETAAVGVVWHSFGKLFEFYYLPAKCQIANPSLPQIFETLPLNLLKQSELKILNLKPKIETDPTGVYWSNYDEKFIPLYDPNRCERDRIDLPGVYLRDGFIPRRRLTNGTSAKVNLPVEFELVPSHLKTAYIWSQKNPLLQVHPETPPRGCVWRNGWEYLYAEEDLILHDRDVYISKTKLKQIYHLPKTLIDKMGKPDYYALNPINDSYPTVHQYSRYRVEQFLKDNAEAYAKHLAQYDRYLAIFNANKDKIAAGRKKAKAIKQMGTKGKVLVQQFKWNPKDPGIYEQCVKCLTCASSKVSNSGFLCAIHPLGLDLESFPCPDWSI